MRPGLLHRLQQVVSIPHYTSHAKCSSGRFVSPFLTRRPFRLLRTVVCGANSLQSSAFGCAASFGKRQCLWSSAGSRLRNAASAANSERPHVLASTARVEQRDILAAVQSEAARPLPPGAVHIYWLDPSQVPADLIQGPCRELLSPEERAHVATAQDPALQQDRVLARTLMRTTLARYCDAVRPKDLEFSRGPLGKPAVAGPAAALTAGQLHFNLSHTHGLLGCAVSSGAAVGLDIESHGRTMRRDPLKLARRHFSSAELASLEGIADEAELRNHFLRLWTLKEAYVKALGRGIHTSPGLQSFTMSLDVNDGTCSSNFCRAGSGRSTGKCTTAVDPGSAGLQHFPTQQASSHSRPLRIGFESAAEPEQQGRWRFRLLEPSPGFTAALCAERKNSGSTAPSLAMWWTVPLLSDEAFDDAGCLLGTCGC